MFPGEEKREKMFIKIVVFFSIQPNNDKKLPTRAKRNDGESMAFTVFAFILFLIAMKSGALLGPLILLFQSMKLLGAILFVMLYFGMLGGGRWLMDETP